MPGRLDAPTGGSGRMTRSAPREAANVTTSAAYAPARPTVARSRPPIAGPTTEAAWKLSWFRAIAAGRWAGLTSRGIAADLVGPSTELSPAAMNATAKIAARGGAGRRARPTRLRLVR